MAGLIDLLLVNEDAPGEDEGLSALARRGEPALDEQFIETELHRQMFIGVFSSGTVLHPKNLRVVLPYYFPMADGNANLRTSTALAWIGWILAVIFLCVAAWLAHHMAFIRGQLDLSEGDAAQLRVQLEHASRIVGVMTSPDASHIVLSETRLTAHPVGEVSWQKSKGAMVFIAAGLRPLPEDKTYELWLVPRGGKAPIPAGLFRPNATHGATVVLPPIPAETDAKLFMVTEEPLHGSTTPSLPIVMEGE